MSLCNVLSQSVLSEAKLLKHLAHTKKLTDHLAAMVTHFRGQWASPRQPITPLNPPPPLSSYVFHLPILPSPLRHSRGQGSGHAKGSGHCPDTLIGQLIWPLLLRGQILSESWAQSEKREEKGGRGTTIEGLANYSLLKRYSDGMKDCTSDKPPFGNLNQTECAGIKTPLPLILLWKFTWIWCQVCECTLRYNTQQQQQIASARLITLSLL